MSFASTSGIRLGLCCLVLDAPIKFRSATHSYVSRLSSEERTQYLNDVALANAAALNEVLAYCVSLDISAFRISSQLFPLATHPVTGYTLDTFPDGAEIRRRLEAARDLARKAHIRLSFHPDQFVVLNSVRPEVVESSIRELEWQSEIAELVGADVICLHGGSAAGGFDDAVDRLIASIGRLSPRARSRLALENDDRSYAAVELLPVCLATGVPLVLDAHHHRVLDGGLTMDEATAWALATWDDRAPYFHISSPRDGWDARDPRPHADFIDATDVPDSWLTLGASLTVDVEAKAKERAVIALQRELATATSDISVAGGHGSAELED